MNPSPEIAAALDLVPGWDAQACRVELLSGGLTNKTFLVDTGNSRAVLRLTADHADPLAPDRSNELDVLHHAAAAGIAPATIFSSIDEGVLVTEYLDGSSWTVADLVDCDNLVRLAVLLRAVHELPACETSADMCAAAHSYARYLDQHSKLAESAARCVAIVDRASHNETVSCCHNDIVAANIIDGQHLMLIDWEYAGNNNPYFDLASLIGFHDLDAAQSEILLHAYSGTVTAEDREQLTEQLRIFDAIQWLWLACQNDLAPTGENTKRLNRLDKLAERIR